MRPTPIATRLMAAEQIRKIEQLLADAQEDTTIPEDIKATLRGWQLKLAEKGLIRNACEAK